MTSAERGSAFACLRDLVRSTGRVTGMSQDLHKCPIVVEMEEDGGV
jgi:hypothetical protein